MAIAINGIKMVFGIKEPKPIFGAPTGRWKLKMRHDAIARLYVKTHDGIRCFRLEDCDDRWFCNPKLEIARNIRQ